MATPILSPTRVQVGYSGHYWSTYQVIAEEGHKPDDCLDPSYWAHVAASRKLRVNDVFEVRCETGDWAIDLLVIEAGARHANVKPLRLVETESPSQNDAALSTVKVKWKGPHAKWGVIRLADSETIKDGFVQRPDAEQYAREYEQRLAA